MTAASYGTLDVPVAGGLLRVGRWGRGGPVVLAVHGMTANHLSWLAVGEELGRDTHLLAPDLRGRGRSGDLPGPFGLAAHARDLVAVLDAVGEERAVVVGHSLGAFVGVVAAARHPDRVAGVVLVDGGLPLPVPPDLGVDSILKAMIGPAMTRLSMTFASREAHRRFWEAHPALRDCDERLWRYLDYDLVGAEPELRSSVAAAAVREDAADTVLSDAVSGALAELSTPAGLVRAERGVMDGEPLLPDALLAAWPQVEDRGRVPGTNHYTIVFDPAGVAAVATAVRDSLASRTR